MASSDTNDWNRSQESVLFRIMVWDGGYGVSVDEYGKKTTPSFNEERYRLNRQSWPFTDDDDATDVDMLFGRDAYRTECLTARQMPHERPACVQRVEDNGGEHWDCLLCRTDCVH